MPHSKPKEYRLTTVEILYSTPAKPHLLQSFIWQDYDQAPDYPELLKFLEFWQSRIEGALYSVRVAKEDTARSPDMVYTMKSTAIH